MTEQIDPAIYARMLALCEGVAKGVYAAPIDEARAIMALVEDTADEAEAKAMCRIWGNNCPQFALACIQRGRELAS